MSGLQAAALLLHLVGILLPHNNDDARSKSLQITHIPLFTVYTT